jgi:hypothetical protein
MTRKLTIVTALLALFAGNAIAAPAQHQNGNHATYTDPQWPYGDDYRADGPIGDFQLQGR